jgi:hypothetical protein
MNIDAVMPWVLFGAGAMQAAVAIRNRRAGHPAVLAAPSVMSVGLGISLLTSGWVHALTWAVMAVCGVLLTVRLFSERTSFGLVVAIPIYALMLAIAVTELLFDNLSTWGRALFGTAAAFIALTLVVMAVHLVQRLRTRRSATV